VLFPVAIVAHDFIDGARTNLITDGTQFSAVGKDGIFERSLFVVVPFTIGITGLCALPLEPVKVSSDNESERVE
jgi:hypothetical protein